MKLPAPKIVALAPLALASLPLGLSAATGEITKSGSNFVAKVDGVTKYTGTSLTSAIHAARDAMSSGNINLRTGGGIGAGEVSFRGKSNIGISGNGNTVSASKSGDTAAFLFRSASTNWISNLTISGNKLYGVRFTGVNGFETPGMKGACGMLIRTDNGGSSGKFSSPNGTATDDSSPGNEHTVETYGLSGSTWSTVTGTDRKGGCALLHNGSSSANGSNVNGTRCDDGGGYAAFRLANSNQSSTVSGTVTARDCGRGFFSTTNSRNGDVKTVNATSCTSHGVFLEDTFNTIVRGGTLSGNNPNKQIVRGSGNTINAN